MNITITIDCSKYNKKKYDIAVNSDQSILECLKIINDSLNINLDFDNINYCKLDICLMINIHLMIFIKVELI